MSDIMKLPGKWRERGKKNAARIHYKYADELEAAMPVGTIVTEDEPTRPPRHDRVISRRKRRNGTWSGIYVCSGWSLDVGELWWPIPGGMFEPPEDK